VANKIVKAALEEDSEPGQGSDVIVSAAAGTIPMKILAWMFIGSLVVIATMVVDLAWTFISSVW
jgi:hypothetical protein